MERWTWEPIWWEWSGAEMPASFEPEALKAQAVAARTYTLYKIQTGGNHGETRRYLHGLHLLSGLHR